MATSKNKLLFSRIREKGEEEMNNQIPNYPLPDPSWDYAELWGKAQEAKAEIEKLIKLMAEAEEASPEIDQKIRIHAEWTHTYIRLLLGKLPQT